MDIARSAFPLIIRKIQKHKIHVQNGKADLSSRLYISAIEKYVCVRNQNFQLIEVNISRSLVGVEEPSTSQICTLKSHVLYKFL